ncbi:glycine betaine ABC transporter substrate-binding protein [Desulfovibrio sp. OttesenSCG-928-C06]|nr:glycine betaine ABC transporter substrate-binding protein [Desulfovibrio sp. OttesenSCG-928-C06]
MKKMQTMSRLMKAFALAALVFTMGSAPALAADKKPVKLVYVEWPCAVATTNIVKVAIEERLGRPCEILPVSVAIKFQSLATGQADATVCAWLPNTQRNYWEKMQDKLEDLGPLVGGARLGWVVPDYVPYTSIEELKGKAAEFGGKIYGIDPGASYTDTSKEAIKEYGLEGFELIEGGDAIMVAMLADSIKKKKPVIVTGWAPHWKFGRWDLHFLDDPKQFFGTEEEIHALVRKGLNEEMPDVYAFLDKFSFKDTKQLQVLMAENMEKGADPLENAKKFIRENKEQVDSWFE